MSRFFCFSRLPYTSLCQKRFASNPRWSAASFSLPLYNVKLFSTQPCSGIYRGSSLFASPSYSPLLLPPSTPRCGSPALAFSPYASARHFARRPEALPPPPRRSIFSRFFSFFSRFLSARAALWTLTAGRYRFAFILLAGGVFLWVFGHVLWVLVKWTVMGTVALLLGAFMYRRYKQAMFKDFFNQSMSLLRAQRRNMEKHVGDSIDLPESIRHVSFSIGETAGPVGDVRRRGVRYSFNVEGPGSVGLAEVFGFEREKGVFETSKITLTMLKPGNGGITPQEIEIWKYGKEKVNIIDAEASEVLEGELIEDKDQVTKNKKKNKNH